MCLIIIIVIILNTALIKIVGSGVRPPGFGSSVSAFASLIDTN